MATGWQNLGAAAYLGAPKAPQKTAAQKRAENKASGMYGTGNWTGESGSWAEPGTYSGNLAAANPGITAGAKNTSEFNSQLYNAMTAMGNGGGQTPLTGTIKRPATSGGSGGGGRGGGGGGGGGGAVAPQLTQDQLAQMWALLGQARPGAQQAGPAFDAPDYAGPQISAFDTSMYDNLRNQLGQAVTNDRAQSDQAYGALNSFMQRNYATNPYEAQTANFGTAPGQSQDTIQRMLAMQGASPGLTQGARSDAAGADQAFGNLLGILGQNQARDYTNRQYAAQQDQANTGRMYDMAKLQGDTGIGLQQGAAKDAWQQRYDARAADIYNQQYQGNLAEQQANWQRANQLSDSNYSTNNQYTNSMLSSVLGNLLPLIIQGGLSVPDIQALLSQGGGTNTVNV